MAVSIYGLLKNAKRGNVVHREEQKRVDIYISGESWDFLKESSKIIRIKKHDIIDALILELKDKLEREKERKDKKQNLTRLTNLDMEFDKTKTS
jgi:hypothetical protein